MPSYYPSTVCHLYCGAYIYCGGNKTYMVNLLQSRHLEESSVGLEVSSNSLALNDDEMPVTRRGCINDVHNLYRLLTETYGWPVQIQDGQNGSDIGLQSDRARNCVIRKQQIFFVKIIFCSLYNILVYLISCQVCMPSM